MEKKVVVFFQGNRKERWRNATTTTQENLRVFSSLYSTKCIKKCTLQFIIENFVYAKKSWNLQTRKICWMCVNFARWWPFIQFANCLIVFFVCKNSWPVHLFSPEGAPASWTHICISDAYRAVLQAWSPPSRQSSQVKTWQAPSLVITS